VSSHQSQLHNAFGEVTSDVGEGARTGYIGREHDVESDLGFNGVRLYEPEYGRFMSTDPLWGRHLSIQPYHYVLNRPMLLIDPSGLDSAGWATFGKYMDVMAGRASVIGGGLMTGLGGALCLAPTGISQVAGVALISLGVGAVAFGGAKAVDAVAALANDEPTHDIPSSYGDLAGSAIDRSLGGDGQIGGMLGSFLEGIAVGSLVKTGTAVSSGVTKSLGPVFFSTVEKSTVGVTLISTLTTAATVSNLVDKSPKSTSPTPKAKDGTGGGMPTPLKREYD